MTSSAPPREDDPHAPRPYDVVVIGGGPAGAAASRLLASWGWSTLLLDRAKTPHPALAESLPPSCRHVLDAVGLGAAVANAGFLETDGNLVVWGDGPVHAADFDGGRVGYQVDRHRFDQVLRAEAARAGVVVRCGVRARAVERASDPRVEPAEAIVTTVAGDGRRAAVRGRLVLDCSGRTGVVAHQHRLRCPLGPRTIALVGVWERSDGWPTPLDRRTLVEDYADGWAWSVPVSSRRRYVTVMVDPHACRVTPPRLTARYLAEIAETHRTAATVHDARLVGAPWVLDASSYTARQFGRAHFVLVGDAATFIDPLSSFGVKKALASAYVAAVVANTMLREPARRAMALRFHATHETRMVEHYRRQTLAFFRVRTARVRDGFWRDRVESPLAPAVGGPDDDLAARFRRDPDVIAAFEALRRASGIRLRPTGRVPVTTGAAIVGCEVVAEPRFVLDAETGLSTRFVGGVDLVALSAMAGRHRQVPDLYAAYQRECGAVGLPDFLGALSVLLGKHVLDNEPDLP